MRRQKNRCREKTIWGLVTMKAVIALKTINGNTLVVVSVILVLEDFRVLKE